jgi:FkbM family methyltransferase
MGLIEIKYEDKSYNIEYANDWIFNEVLANKNFFEFNLLEILKYKVKSFNFVLDIGANVGNHSFYFSKICKANKIIAFEPDPNNSLIYNKNNPEATLIPIALSNYIGDCYFQNSSPYNSGTGKISSEGNRVKVSTLDYFNLQDITFIKIDVEGEELKVLEGMVNTIKSSKPEMLIEVHYGITINDVINILPVNYEFELIQDHQYFLKPII